MIVTVRNIIASGSPRPKTRTFNRQRSTVRASTPRTPMGHALTSRLMAILICHRSDACPSLLVGSQRRPLRSLPCNSCGLAPSRLVEPIAHASELCCTLPSPLPALGSCCGRVTFVVEEPSYCGRAWRANGSWGVSDGRAWRAKGSGRRRLSGHSGPCSAPTRHGLSWLPARASPRTVLRLTATQRSVRCLGQVLPTQLSPQP
jgi:hypothetical protein